METINYKGYKIEVEYDEFSESPREWDNIGTMVCFHRRHALGDKHFLPSNMFNSWEEVEDYLIKEKEAVVILPLYLFDHSGVTMRTYPFDGFGYYGRFDSGQVGYIYVSRDYVKENYKVKRISKKLKERLKKILEEEVKIYDKYLRGEIYRYAIYNDKGKFIDSCGGFYDYDYMLEEAKNIIDSDIESRLKERANKLKNLIRNKVSLEVRERELMKV